MISSARPHDLLQIDPSGTGLRFDGFESEALRCLERAPYVVVRRARMRDGLVPVGIRGASRDERFAAWLNPSATIAIHRPETVRSRTPGSAMAPFAALTEIEKEWDKSFNMPWGPTGSVGFELVSGVRVVSADSDLDVLLHAKRRCPRELLKDIKHTTDELSCTVDVQIETPEGAFSLNEYLTGKDTIRLRTLDGPRLVRDPWHPEVVSSTVLR